MPVVVRSLTFAGWLVAGTAFAADKEETWPEFRPSELRVLKQSPVEPPESFRTVEYADVRCVVRAYVKASGKPVRIDVDSCREGLTDAVVDSVRKWRWLMPLVDGKRSPGQVPMTVRFKVGTRSRTSVVEREYKVKTAEAFSDTPEGEVNPRVMPIEVPDSGSVVVDGGLPWTAESTPLVLTKRVDPQFPQAAADAGQYDDICDVRLVVSKNGTPTDLAISGCAERFERVTQSAVSKWRWEVPMAVEKEGSEPEPVEARLRFDVLFRAFPDSFYDDDPAAE